MKELSEWFCGRGRTMVALSGGVDSALVAFAAHKTLGADAIAVTADYKTLSAEELASAKNVCGEIGIRHILIDYDELENEDFARNDKNRCFHCRIELARHLHALTQKHGVRTIVDGTNLSDLGDYRPGIRAMRENRIRSPLADVRFTKDDVRREAKNAGLSTHDRPSNSCLASRIPWGRRVTAERLARIELGETFVKNKTNARQVRVRDMDGVAKIEVDPDSIERISGGALFNELKSQLCLIGFKSVTVDPKGYRPGKINVIAD